MDMSQHNMENLFMQMGLESNEEAIEDFMADHTLQEDEKLEDASFWSASQAAFIKECLASDSDWAEVVDQLNVQLRQ